MNKCTLAGGLDTRILILFAGIGLMVAWVVQSTFAPGKIDKELYLFFVQLLILAQLTKIEER